VAADPPGLAGGHAHHQGVIGHVPGHHRPAAMNAYRPIVAPQTMVALAPTDAPRLKCVTS